jgi:hypothetical protein
MNKPSVPRFAYPALILVAPMAAGCGESATFSNSDAATQDAKISDAATPSEDATAPAFPLGTYTSCADGIHGAGHVVNTAGVQSGASLTLAQAGSTVTASYVDGNGVHNEFDFVPTSQTSATLAPHKQVATGLATACMGTIGVGPLHHGSLDLTSGELTYDARTVFAFVEGTAEVDGGGTCPGQSSPATYWIICGEGDGGAMPPPDAGAPSVPPPFPVGDYTCDSEIATYSGANGLHGYGTDVGTGSLRVAQMGGEVTAAYTGDVQIAGTLKFVVTTSASASAEPGQSLTASCPPVISRDGGIQRPPPGNYPLSVSAASLIVDATTLYVSFVATTGSTCPGEEQQGTLICAKQ